MTKIKRRKEIKQQEINKMQKLEEHNLNQQKRLQLKKRIDS
jgi:copper(I)-binding protein